MIAMSTTATAYRFEGTLLEACNCGVLCPCWIGEDPDNGTCDAITAHHIDRGEAGGVDVSGLTWVSVVFIPGNVLAGKWRRVCYVDEKATPEQVRALADAFQGRLGGPLADLAGLVGEEVGVYQAPIENTLVDGAGTLRVGDRVTVVAQPYHGPDGSVTTLRDSIFSTVPGSPAYVSKASEVSAAVPEHGFVWSYSGSNAIQADFNIAA
jgi:hypothetical protein